jgi:hypothetical protein
MACQSTLVAAAYRLRVVVSERRAPPGLRAEGSITKPQSEGERYHAGRHRDQCTRPPRARGTLDYKGRGVGELTKRRRLEVQVQCPQEMGFVGGGGRRVKQLCHPLGVAMATRIIRARTGGSLRGQTVPRCTLLRSYILDGVHLHALRACLRSRPNQWSSRVLAPRAYVDVNAACIGSASTPRTTAPAAPGAVHDRVPAIHSSCDTAVAIPQQLARAVPCVLLKVDPSVVDLLERALVQLCDCNLNFEARDHRQPVFVARSASTYWRNMFMVHECRSTQHCASVSAASVCKLKPRS